MCLLDKVSEEPVNSADTFPVFRVPFIVRTLIDAGLTEKDCSLEAMSFGGAPSGENGLHLELLPLLISIFRQRPHWYKTATKRSQKPSSRKVKHARHTRRKLNPRHLHFVHIASLRYDRE